LNRSLAGAAARLAEASSRKLPGAQRDDSRDWREAYALFAGDGLCRFMVWARGAARRHRFRYRRQSGRPRAGCRARAFRLSDNSGKQTFTPWAAAIYPWVSLLKLRFTAGCVRGKTSHWQADRQGRTRFWGIRKITIRFGNPQTKAELGAGWGLPKKPVEWGHATVRSANNQP